MTIAILSALVILLFRIDSTSHRIQLIPVPSGSRRTASADSQVGRSPEFAAAVITRFYSRQRRRLPAGWYW